jgi:selenocysteine lyase/cysteine desulfurase
VVAEEFPWQTGDRIILIKGEFPGNIVPWLNAAKRFDLTVDWLEIEDLLNETPEFLAAMQRNPRFMAVSWVQYQTGVTLDLEQVSQWRERFGITLCVDAIQGLGGLAMDLKKIPLDFVICGGHKWLMGPEGAGFLIIAPEWQAKLKPVLAGWLSQEKPIDFLIQGAGHVDYHKAYRQSADRTEFATMSNVLFAGLAASIKLLLEADPQRTQKHVPALAEQLRTGMKELGLPVNETYNPSGIASAPLATPRLQRVLKALDDKGISATGPDGHLRFAPHFYQTSEEMKLVLETLSEIL